MKLFNAVDICECASVTERFVLGLLIICNYITVTDGELIPIVID